MLVREAACLHVHRKLNLPTYGRLEEGKHYAAGRAHRAFALPAAGAAATLICADTWNPALPWLAACAAARCSCSSRSARRWMRSATTSTIRAGWDCQPRLYALTYGLPIVMANHAARAAL